MYSMFCDVKAQGPFMHSITGDCPTCPTLGITLQVPLQGILLVICCEMFDRGQVTQNHTTEVLGLHYLC
jgi:hypothetical protein